MKLHQLRYLAAVAQTGLNITAAAEKLHTSQPGVSKQIKLLEDELGFQIFVRDGRNLARVTPAGQQVIDRAVRILREVRNIKHLSEELKDESTGSQSLFDGYALLPCYQWHRHVVVPKSHPFAKLRKLTLKQLAAQPIVTYVFGFTGPSSLQQIFADEGLVPNVVLTARDADVIKTYVRLGLGVGIVASMAIDSDDDDLVEIDTSDLFPAHVTWIGFRRGGLLRKYQLDFMQLFAPHLTRRVIERAANANTQAEVDALTKDIELPLR